MLIHQETGILRRRQCEIRHVAARPADRDLFTPVIVQHDLRPVNRKIGLRFRLEQAGLLHRVNEFGRQPMGGDLCVALPAHNTGQDHLAVLRGIEHRCAVGIDFPAFLLVPLERFLAFHCCGDRLSDRSGAFLQVDHRELCVFQLLVRQRFTAVPAGLVADRYREFDIREVVGEVIPLRERIERMKGKVPLIGDRRMPVRLVAEIKADFIIDLPVLRTVHGAGRGYHAAAADHGSDGPAVASAGEMGFDHSDAGVRRLRFLRQDDGCVGAPQGHHHQYQQECDDFLSHVSTLRIQ